MSLKNVISCTPADTYVIVERIYGKRILPAIDLKGLGPELFQVVRSIGQVCSVFDTFHDGKRLSGPVNLQQYLQHLIGWKKLTTRPTGKDVLRNVYVGFKNVVQPLPKIGDSIPEALTSMHVIPTPSIYFYGSDPIPHIQLYGNNMVNFVSPGGQPPPTAVAIGLFKRTGCLWRPDGDDRYTRRRG